jgi:cytochrome c oxidase cbb3-type subunit III
MSERYTDPLLDHEYDGIREFDNPMPGWWKTIFWRSFYFAIGYFFHFHISQNGDSVAEAYELDVAAAREREAKELMGETITEEGIAGLMSNTALMADAQKTFVQRCAQCHGANAEGKIGPNLTDNFWLHGDGTLMGFMKIITEGVPAKGMPPWGRQLRPVEISKLAAFIGTLRGTNVPGPKGPEGTELSASAGSAGASGSAPTTTTASTSGTGGSPVPTTPPAEAAPSGTPASH